MANQKRLNWRTLPQELLLEILDARNESVHNINEEEEDDDRILTKEDWMQCALSCRNWAIVTQQPRFLNFDQQEEKLQRLKYRLEPCQDAQSQLFSL